MPLAVFSQVVGVEGSNDFEPSPSPRMKILCFIALDSKEEIHVESVPFRGESCGRKVGSNDLSVSTNIQSIRMRQLMMVRKIDWNESYTYQEEYFYRRSMFSGHGIQPFS